MPSTEWIVWGLLPALAAFGAIALSLQVAIRQAAIIQVGLSVAVVVLSLFALLVLKRIFIDGAWPSALPHLAIAASCGLAGVQRWVSPRANPAP